MDGTMARRMLPLSALRKVTSATLGGRVSIANCVFLQASELCAVRSTSSCPVVTSVAIQPGETPLARMRCGAPWTASARVSASTAALAMP